MKTLKLGNLSLETYGEKERLSREKINISERFRQAKSKINKFRKSKGFKKFKEGLSTSLKSIGEQYNKISKSDFAKNARETSIVGNTGDYFKNPAYNTSYFERTKKHR